MSRISWRHGRALVVVIFVVCSLLLGGSIFAGSVAAQSDPVNVDPSELPGSGTETDPYVITNVSELQAMEKDLDAHYELGSDINANKTTTWDGGAGFDPVGNDSTEFAGSFDGRLYTISQLTIQRPSANDIGLFGNIEEGVVIQQVRLLDVRIHGNNNVGGAVGSLETGSVVRNVSTSGDVQGADDVGGVVGQNYRQSIVTQSVSNATINASAPNSRAGGLVGGNYRGSAINQSYATGQVTANRAGGIVGENYNNSSVSAVYTTGAVHGQQDEGGILGFNFKNSIVSDSYWNTETTNQSTGIDASDTSIPASVVGLTTSELIGSNAKSNMPALAFGSAWQTQSGDYPILTWQRDQAPTEQPLETLTITISPSSITAGSQTQVTVTAQDATSRSGVEGATFQSPPLGVSATTNASGMATVQLTASQPGNYTVSATAQGYSEATTTLTVTGENNTGVPPDAVYGPDSTAAAYDSNNDGKIDVTELGTAATAFAQQDISITGLAEVASAFAAS